MTRSTNKRSKSEPLSFWGVTKKTVADSVQSESGNVDPARLAYFFTAACAAVFIWGTVYDTVKNHHFSGTDFAIGAGGVAALIISSAGGVRIKNMTELPLSAQTSGMPSNPPMGGPSPGSPGDAPAGS